MALSLALGLLLCTVHRRVASSLMLKSQTMTVTVLLNDSDGSSESYLHQYRENLSVCGQCLLLVATRRAIVRD